MRPPWPACWLLMAIHCIELLRQTLLYMCSFDVDLPEKAGPSFMNSTHLQHYLEARL